MTWGRSSTSLALGARPCHIHGALRGKQSSLCRTRLMRIRSRLQGFSALINTFKALGDYKIRGSVNLHSSGLISPSALCLCVRKNLAFYHLPSFLELIPRSPDEVETHLWPPVLLSSLLLWTMYSELIQISISTLRFLTSCLMDYIESLTSGPLAGAAISQVLFICAL